MKRCEQRLVMLTAALILSGCGSYSLQAGREKAIISSIRYDHLSCEETVVQRDSLAARYGLAADVKREPGKESFTIGLSPIIPDLRSRKTAEVELAIGQITAMNDSMRRRTC